MSDTATPSPDDLLIASVRRHLAAAGLDKFAGADFTVRALSDPDPLNAASNGIHAIGTPRFAALCHSSVRLGWSVFPQLRDERRGPAKVDGVPLRWKAYQSQLPSAEDLSWWAAAAPTENVAAILGDASGGTFAVDVDVDDLKLSVAIQRLADEILGYTPLRRVGRHPRIVLIYRQGLRDTLPRDEVVPSRQLAFVKKGDGEDARSPGGLEILSHGKPVTFHGLHHKTGQHFRWLDRSPHTVGPEAAPLVTRAQVDAFLDAVDELHTFSRRAAREVLGESFAYDAAAALHRPVELGVAPEWETAEGKVINGRESFLFSLARQTVRANEGAARDPRTGVARLCNLVEGLFRERAEMGGRWSDAFLRNEVLQKVQASVRWHLEGDHRFAVPLAPGRVTAVDPEGRVEHAPSLPADAPEPEEAPELAHLKSHVLRRGVLPEAGESKRKRAYRLLLAADPVRALKRALVTDEKLRLGAAHAAVSAVAAHEERWIEALYDRAAERSRRKRLKIKAPLDAGEISILRGDAGVGKTSSFWKVLARLVDTRGRLGYPIGFAMPSHANIADSLDGAKKAELAWEKSCLEAVQQGERHGLKVVVFKGKARSNCAFIPQLQALQAANIKTEALCKSKVNRNAGIPDAEPDWEVVRCPAFERCEYQALLAEVASADVVLFASAYLNVTAPANLSKALIGLVVDERPYSGLLRTNSEQPLALSVLSLGRPAPRLDKEELAPLLGLANARQLIEDRRVGYLAERDAAVKAMLPHLRAGHAGAAVLTLHRLRNPGGRRLGLEYASSAYTVCSRGSNLAKDVKPGMTEAEAVALASTPQGDAIWEERRFWKIVLERLEALRDDEENPGTPLRAKGAHDARLQVVVDTVDGSERQGIRMSWRGQPSFPNLPLLLLDASAAPAIVRKVWSDRVVEVLDVEAPSYLRVVLVTGSTFSDRSMLPGKARRIADIQRAAEQVHLNREVVTRLAGVHGYGRMLVGGNKPVMAVFRRAFRAPANVDFVHNGAMRGLDFAKNHAAAFLFGRLELPIRAIDAYVAALTYDDDEPEMPVDRLGTGLDFDGNLIGPTVGTKVVQLRDGRDIGLDDAVYQGAWASLVQRQWREEEVRQFAARLRPVHRTGRAPVVYLACAAIPEGMVVDDVIDIKDLLHAGPAKSARPWEVARETRGLLDHRFGWQAREDLGGADGSLMAQQLEPLRLDGADKPETQGTTRIRWRWPGGEWTASSVLSWDADLVAPLRRALAAEHGYTEEEVDEVLEVEILRSGTARAPSGIRAPDTIDLANNDLPAGSSREAVLQATADAEAIERESMMARIRSELSGLPQDADPAEIEAALQARRIKAIDWTRLKAFPGASRTTNAVPLGVRILMACYGADEAEDLD